MRISAKGRYAVAALTEVARRTSNGGLASITEISEALGISAGFLEQVFALLKRGKLVLSEKGKAGGYKIAKPPNNITIFAVLSVLENLLFGKADDTVTKQAPAIESTLRDLVWNKLDESIEASLSSVTLQDLLEYSEQQIINQSFMLYM